MSHLIPISTTTDAWEQMPSGLIDVLADHLRVAIATAPHDLANLYGTPPDEEFIRQNWLVIRDNWLRGADDARRAVVAALWDLGVGYADDYPAGSDAEMAFLRTCNNARGLREAVLAELIRLDRSSEGGQSVMPEGERASKIPQRPLSGDTVPRSDAVGKGRPPVEPGQAEPPEFDSRPWKIADKAMTVTAREVIRNHAAFIWSVADLLRGDYKQSEYGRVILPLVVLRRLDCVLEPSKAKVLAMASKLVGRVQNVEPLLCQASGEQFYNTSPLSMPRLLDDHPNIADNLRSYTLAFSAGARDILEKFDLSTQIDRLDGADLLYLVVSKFCEVDLHPDVVSNLEMGYLYEELIRRFSELSNETAGEHFTPREVIRLMVNLLFIEDDQLLTKPGVVKTMLDPACGTGGMLSVAEDHLRSLNPQARLEVYGQELNPETYAICRSDMMLKGQDASHIVLGNSFSEDGFVGQHFDYLLANPPFGVEWKKVEKPIRDEHGSKGFAGRFGAGLPRINDGSFLFLQHMIAKMKPVEQGGSRLAIVFNGSPLFTGAAGSGESEIRRWIIENDWLEAVVALPDQLFYNTGISTYFWVITNRKHPERRGKVQLVDVRGLWHKLRKSLGEKRKELSDEHIAEITRLYGSFKENDDIRILPNEAFGFLRITVERPLRLRWEITDETLVKIRYDKKLSVLGDEIINNLVGALVEHRGLFSAERKVVANVVDPLLQMVGLSTTHQKAVWQALAVRDPEAPVILARNGEPEPDPELRDQENVPLPAIRVGYEEDPTHRLAAIEYRTAIEDHLQNEVQSYVTDAWVDQTKTKIGYEVPITRYFYKYVPPRPLEEIDAEIEQLETEIQELLHEVTE